MAFTILHNRRFNNCFAVTATGDGMNISVGGGYVNIKGKTKYFEQAQIFTLEKRPERWPVSTT